MGWSMDCLDYNHERNAIPVQCWKDVCLSKIWIPVHLLPNRTSVDNTQATQGIYHTLERKDFLRYNQSFSVYSGTEQEEIFFSDSENGSNNDIFNSGSLEKIERPESTIFSLNYSGKYEEYIKNENSNENSKVKNISCLGTHGKLNNDEKTSKYLKSEKTSINSLKCRKEDNVKYNVTANELSKISNSESQNNMTSFKVIKDVNFSDSEVKHSETSKTASADASSHISLNEILDETQDVNIKKFTNDFNLGTKLTSLFVPDEDRKEGSKSKKNKDKKMKKKSKCIGLDKFLENVVDNSQEYYCDKYFQNLFRDENQNFQSSSLPTRREAEFPDLVSEEFQFIHSNKTKEKVNSELSFKSLIRQLEKPDEVSNYGKNNDDEEQELTVSDSPKLEKIVVENIPCETSEEDILLILCGYGEIKDISVISDGKFLKAFVEIDLICDIDWIIECLNGSEPFGASSGVLKCYKVS